MAYIREGAPSYVRRLANEFTTRGITLPTEIRDALHQLDTLESNRPEQVGQVQLIDAYLNEASNEEIDALAVAAETCQRRTDAHREACIKHALRTENLFTAHGTELTRALATVAAPLIANLTRCAELYEDLAALVRSGRHDDAALIGQLDLDAAELQALYTVRGYVTTGAVWKVDWTDCSQWKDPHRLDVIEYRGTTAERFLAGIRAGAGLWFPTPDESVAQAKPIAAEIRTGERTHGRSGANFA